MKWLSTRYATRCYRCSADIGRGDNALFVRSRVLLCRTCAPECEAAIARADEKRRELVARARVPCD